MARRSRAQWLGEILSLPARDRPDDVGITWVRGDRGADTETRTYAELWEGALRGAAGLRRVGVERGGRVIIALATGWEFLDAYFGASLIGAVPVPTAPPVTSRPKDLSLWVEGIGRLEADCAAAAVLIPEPRREATSALRAKGAALLSTGWNVGPPLSERAVVAPAGPDDVATLQYTSGTTGTPQGIPLTHGNLMANADAIEAALDPIPGEVTVSWLPLFHDMGLLGTVVTVVREGVPLVLMSPQDFVRRPMSWLQTISEYRGTITVAPNFAFDYCVRRADPGELEGVDLSSLRIALNGAEPVDLAAARRFQEAFAPYGLPPNVIRPVYGLAEATLAVTFSDAGPFNVDPPTGRVSVGRPVQGVEVEIRTPDGSPAEEREVGEICVRGASVTVEGWLETADLGYLAGGELFVTGRSQDLIIVHGQNLYPQDLEAHVCAVEGVWSGGAVAFGQSDSVSVVAESRVRGHSERRAVERAVRERLVSAFGFAPNVTLVRVGELPRTTSGKLRRSAAAERFPPARSRIGSGRSAAAR